MRRVLAEGTISTERLAQSIERIRKTKARFLGRGEEISLAKVKEYFGRSV
jgi:hypothetical protein